MYDGGREAGRPAGKGTLKYPEKRGSYDGDFLGGRRHGYGVENAYVAPLEEL
jgi:MORN repeat